MLPRTARTTLIASATVVAVALGARLTPWTEVFTPLGVRLVVDTDPHYHVLRAERLLRGEGSDAWFDPGLAHPAGARILWPPGFDAVVAGAALAVHGAVPSRAELESVAVFVPVVMGVLAVVLQLLFAARWLGPVAALAAGLLAAVIPMQVQYGALGVVDQHVAEQLGFCAALLGLARCGARGRAGPVLLALALAAGPWMWQGAILTTGFVVVGATVVFVLRPEGSEAAAGLLRRAALGCAAGGGALALSMLAWGPPPELRSPGLNGLSPIHPIATLVAALGLAALAELARRRPEAPPARRAAAAAIAGAVAAGIVLAAAPGAVLHGVRSLRATDAWLRTVTEFQPVLGSIGSFREDVAWVFWAVGPLLAAPAVGLGAFRRRWARAPEARSALTILAAGTALFVGLFLARSRFVVYAAPFLAWWGGLFLADAIERARTGPRRASRGAVAIAAALAFLVPCARLVPTPYRSVLDERLVAMLGWMRAQDGAGRGGVLAPWTLGHAIQYYAGAPVVVTPFGTDLGPDGMRRLAAFYYARSPAEAEQVLRDADVRWVLLEPSVAGVSDAAPFAPAGAVPLVAEARAYWARGRSVAPLPAFGESVLGTLYAGNGAPPDAAAGARGIPFLRLVYETSPRAPFRLFERVEGARVHVRGAAPGEIVSVLVEVLTGQRRRILWSASASADAAGVASFRVPYATGQNGTTSASMYAAAVGSAVRYFAVPEAAVARGLGVDLALADLAAQAGLPR